MTSRALCILALLFAGVAAYAAAHVPQRIGPGPGGLTDVHPGVAVKTFDSRWIPVTTRNRDILEVMRELRLQTSTMWFRVDCSETVYERHEIGLVFEGGTVWVAAGHPKPTAPPARCLQR